MRCNVSAALALILWGAGVTTAAVAQQPVKVGVLNDQTGLYADLSGMGSVYAARMAVEDYRGKVLGRPIEVIFADHQNKPDVGASIARQWIETDGVNVILDLLNASVGLAVREVTRTHDAVDINTGAATSDLTGKACSPHGVLCIRACSRARHHGVRRGRRRQGGRGCAPSAQYRRLLVLSAAGASLEGEDHRSLERRRRYHQLDQTGRGIWPRPPGRPAPSGAPAAVS
jgi:hypothetical protein